MKGTNTLRNLNEFRPRASAMARLPPQVTSESLALLRRPAPEGRVAVQSERRGVAVCQQLHPARGRPERVVRPGGGDGCEISGMLAVPCLRYNQVAIGYNRPDSIEPTQIVPSKSF